MGYNSLYQNTRKNCALRNVGVFFTILSFSVTTFTPPHAWAANLQSLPPEISAGNLRADLTAIPLPEEIGTIRDIYQCRDTACRAPTTLVVLIEDAHSIPAAQKNIQSIIHFFESYYGIQTVFTEGAISQLDPQIFLSFPDPERLSSVMKTYMDQGELTGVNAAALQRENPDCRGTACRAPTQFSGMENWSLYEKGIAAYQTAMAQKKELGEALSVKREESQKQKEKIYSKELLEIDQARNKFDEDQSSILDLLRVAATYQPPKEYPALMALLQQSIDHSPWTIDKQNQEIKKIADQIGQALKASIAMDYACPPEQCGRRGLWTMDLKAFNEKRQAYQTSQISPEAYALYLKELAERLKLKIKIPTVLASGIQREEKIRDIRGTELFRNLEQYVDKVSRSLLRSPEEKKLYEQGERLKILDRLADLKLTQEDWRKLKSIVHSPRLPLRSGGQAWSTENKEERLLWSMDDGLWTHHLEFYEIAEKRNEAFLRNIIKIRNPNIEARNNIQIQNSKDPNTRLKHLNYENSNLFRISNFDIRNSAMLVAGGFHTEGLTQLLKSSGTSYVLVMPKIQEFPAEDLYPRHMQGDVSWKNYFRAENGRVNLYEAFVRGTRDQLISGIRDKGKGISEKPFPTPYPLSPTPDFVKPWRDQILRDLAAQGRISEAGKYTRFIDEITSQGAKSLDYARDGEPVEPRMAHGEENNWIERSALGAMRSAWLSAIDQFGAGLKQLRIDNRLNRNNILDLIRSVTSTSSAPALASALDPKSFVSENMMGEHPYSLKAIRPDEIPTAQKQVSRAEVRSLPAAMNTPPGAAWEQRSEVRSAPNARSIGDSRGIALVSDARSEVRAENNRVSQFASVPVSGEETILRRMRWGALSLGFAGILAITVSLIRTHHYQVLEERSIAQTVEGVFHAMPAESLEKWSPVTIKNLNELLQQYPNLESLIDKELVRIKNERAAKRNQDEWNRKVQELKGKARSAIERLQGRYYAEIHANSIQIDFRNPDASLLMARTYLRILERYPLRRGWIKTIQSADLRGSGELIIQLDPEFFPGIALPQARFSVTGDQVSGSVSLTRKPGAPPVSPATNSLAPKSMRIDPAPRSEVRTNPLELLLSPQNYQMLKTQTNWLNPNRKILESDIQFLHRMVTQDGYDDGIHEKSGEDLTLQEITPGRYRKSNLADRGAFRMGAKARRIPVQMKQLTEWFNANEKLIIDKEILAAEAFLRFIDIHPFNDANGRTGRLLINILLTRWGRPLISYPLLPWDDSNVIGYATILPEDAIHLGFMIRRAQQNHSSVGYLRHGPRVKGQEILERTDFSKLRKVKSYDFLNWIRSCIGFWVPLEGIQEVYEKTSLSDQEYAEFIKILQAIKSASTKSSTAREAQLALNYFKSLRSEVRKERVVELQDPLEVDANIVSLLESADVADQSLRQQLTQKGFGIDHESLEQLLIKLGWYEKQANPYFDQQPSYGIHNQGALILFAEAIFMDYFRNARPKPAPHQFLMHLIQDDPAAKSFPPMTDPLLLSRLVSFQGRNGIEILLYQGIENKIISTQNGLRWNGHELDKAEISISSEGKGWLEVADRYGSGRFIPGSPNGIPFKAAHPLQKGTLIRILRFSDSIHDIVEPIRQSALRSWDLKGGNFLENTSPKAERPRLQVEHPKMRSLTGKESLVLLQPRPESNEQAVYHPKDDYPYSIQFAEAAADQISRMASEFKDKEFNIFVKGTGSGLDARTALYQALKIRGFKKVSIDISDINPLAVENTRENIRDLVDESRIPFQSEVTSGFPSGQKKYHLVLFNAGDVIEGPVMDDTKQMSSEDFAAFMSDLQLRLASGGVALVRNEKNLLNRFPEFRSAFDIEPAGTDEIGELKPENRSDNGSEIFRITHFRSENRAFSKEEIRLDPQIRWPSENDVKTGVMLGIDDVNDLLEKWPFPHEVELKANSKMESRLVPYALIQKPGGQIQREQFMDVILSTDSKSPNTLFVGHDDPQNTFLREYVMTGKWGPPETTQRLLQQILHFKRQKWFLRLEVWAEKRGFHEIVMEPLEGTDRRSLQEGRLPQIFIQHGYHYDPLRNRYVRTLRSEMRSSMSFLKEQIQELIALHNEPDEPSGEFLSTSFGADRAVQGFVFNFENDGSIVRYSLGKDKSELMGSAAVLELSKLEITGLKKRLAQAMGVQNHLDLKVNGDILIDTNGELIAFDFPQGGSVLYKILEKVRPLLAETAYTLHVQLEFNPSDRTQIQTLTLLVPESGLRTASGYADPELAEHTQRQLQDLTRAELNRLESIEELEDASPDPNELLPADIYRAAMPKTRDLIAWQDPSKRLHILREHYIRINEGLRKFSAFNHFIFSPSGDLTQCQILNWHFDFYIYDSRLPQHSNGNALIHKLSDIQEQVPPEIQSPVREFFRKVRTEAFGEMEHWYAQSDVSLYFGNGHFESSEWDKTFTDIFSDIQQWQSAKAELLMHDTSLAAHLTSAINTMTARIQPTQRSEVRTPLESGDIQIITGTPMHGLPSRQHTSSDPEDPNKPVHLLGEIDTEILFSRNLQPYWGADKNLIPFIPKEWFKNKDVLVVPGYGNLPFIIKAAGAQSVTGVDIDPVTIAWQRAKAQFAYEPRIQYIFGQYQLGSRADLIKQDFLSNLQALVQHSAQEIQYQLEGVNFKQGDLRISLPLEKDTQDLVVIPYLMGVPNGLQSEEELDQALQESLRVLRPGGRILVLPGRVGPTDLSNLPNAENMKLLDHWLTSLKNRGLDVAFSPFYPHMHLAGMQRIQAAYAVLTPQRSAPTTDGRLLQEGRLPQIFIQHGYHYDPLRNRYVRTLRSESRVEAQGADNKPINLTLNLDGILEDLIEMASEQGFSMQFLGGTARRMLWGQDPFNGVSDLDIALHTKPDYSGAESISSRINEFMNAVEKRYPDLAVDVLNFKNAVLKEGSYDGFKSSPLAMTVDRMIVEKRRDGWFVSDENNGEYLESVRQRIIKSISKSPSADSGMTMEGALRYVRLVAEYPDAQVDKNTRDAINLFVRRGVAESGDNRFTLRVKKVMKEFTQGDLETLARGAHGRFLIPLLKIVMHAKYPADLIESLESVGDTQTNLKTLFEEAVDLKELIRIETQSRAIGRHSREVDFDGAFLVEPDVGKLYGAYSDKDKFAEMIWDTLVKRRWLSTVEVMGKEKFNQFVKNELFHLNQISILRRMSILADISTLLFFYMDSPNFPNNRLEGMYNFVGGDFKRHLRTHEAEIEGKIGKEYPSLWNYYFSIYLPKLTELETGKQRAETRSELRKLSLDSQDMMAVQDIETWRFARIAATGSENAYFAGFVQYPSFMLSHLRQWARLHPEDSRSESFRSLKDLLQTAQTNGNQKMAVYYQPFDAAMGGYLKFHEKLHLQMTQRKEPAHKTVEKTARENLENLLTRLDEESADFPRPELQEIKAAFYALLEALKHYIADTDHDEEFFAWIISLEKYPDAFDRLKAFQPSSPEEKEFLNRYLESENSAVRMEAPVRRVLAAIERVPEVKLFFQKYSEALFQDSSVLVRSENRSTVPDEFVEKQNQASTPARIPSNIQFLDTGSQANGFTRSQSTDTPVPSEGLSLISKGLKISAGMLEGHQPAVHPALKRQDIILSRDRRQNNVLDERHILFNPVQSELNPIQPILDLTHVFLEDLQTFAKDPKLAVNVFEDNLELALAGNVGAGAVLTHHHTLFPLSEGLAFRGVRNLASKPGAVKTLEASNQKLDIRRAQPPAANVQLPTSHAQITSPSTRSEVRAGRYLADTPILLADKSQRLKEMRDFGLALVLFLNKLKEFSDKGVTTAPALRNFLDWDNQYQDLLTTKDKKIDVTSYLMTGFLLTEPELIQRLNELNNQDAYFLENALMAFDVIRQLARSQNPITFGEVKQMYRIQKAQSDQEFQSMWKMGKLLFEPGALENSGRSLEMDEMLLERALNIVTDQMPKRSEVRTKEENRSQNLDAGKIQPRNSAPLFFEASALIPKSIRSEMREALKFPEDAEENTEALVDLAMTEDPDKLVERLKQDVRDAFKNLFKKGQSPVRQRTDPPIHVRMGTVPGSSWTDEDITAMQNIAQNLKASISQIQNSHLSLAIEDEDTEFENQLSRTALLKLLSEHPGLVNEVAWKSNSGAKMPTDFRTQLKDLGAALRQVDPARTFIPLNQQAALPLIRGLSPSARESADPSSGGQGPVPLHGVFLPLAVSQTQNQDPILADFVELLRSVAALHLADLITSHPDLLKGSLSELHKKLLERLAILGTDGQNIIRFSNSDSGFLFDSAAAKIYLKVQIERLTAQSA